MIVNRLVVYACCVFLTYVSVTEAVTVDEKTQGDFNITSDHIDFYLTHITDPDELLAQLNENLKENKFIEIWNHVQKAQECDAGLASELLVMNELAAPSQKYGSLTISKMVYIHFRHALEICSSVLEQRFEIVNGRELELTEGTSELLNSVGVIMQRICGEEDEFCLRYKLWTGSLVEITRAIYGHKINGEKEINRIKLSYKILSLFSICGGIHQSIEELLRVMIKFGEKLGPKMSNIMRLMFVCREFKGREHHYIDGLAGRNGERDDRPTPCYELSSISEVKVPRRRPCP